MTTKASPLGDVAGPSAPPSDRQEEEPGNDRVASRSASSSSNRSGVHTPSNLSTAAILAENLEQLTFHESPPPSLAARFPTSRTRIPMFGDEAGRGSRVGGPEIDNMAQMDPHVEGDQDRIATLIKHLTHTDADDTQPHLLAIGHELEALCSIYPGAIKLATTSRPPSININLDETVDKVTVEAHETPHQVSHRRDVSGSSISSVEELPPRIPGQQAVQEHRHKSHEGDHPSAAWLDAVLHESLGISPLERIRYELTIPLWDEGEVLDGIENGDMPHSAPMMRLLVSLGPNYPTTGPPQLQLLGRYLGSFPIDAGLFGEITRTYITAAGVPFTPGDVCVFEGLTYVQDLCKSWYAQNLKVIAEHHKAREASRETSNDATPSDASTDRPSTDRATFSYSSTYPNDSVSEGVPSAGLKIHHAEPIVDRKSTFLGHSVRVDDERQVPLVIHELLSDKKIARAAHPAIFAYRIAKDVGGAAGKVISSDYDDDGESQAGARLIHLLDILEVENVLVVVTRWFGGTLLGPDRFKHINQAARDALEVGGFLDVKEGKEGKKGRRK